MIKLSENIPRIPESLSSAIGLTASSVDWSKQKYWDSNGNVITEEEVFASLEASQDSKQQLFNDEFLESPDGQKLLREMREYAASFNTE
jgi:hypothetical protein